MRFAVHGPGIPDASPRSHGVSRRDVHGRVHVSVAGVSAGGAPEDGLTLARRPVHLPARRAALARVRGFDLLHPAGSFLRQAAYQQPPPRPQDAPVEPGFLPGVAGRVLPGALRGPGHVLDLEVLDPDHVEPARDVRAGLLRPVLAPVRLAGPQPGDGELHPRPAVRPAARPGQLAFQPPQARALGRGQAGGVQQLPCRQGCGDRHAPVDAHRLAVARRGDRPGNGGEGDMPASCAVHGHPVGLHARGHRAGPAESHPSGLRHPHLADVPGQAAHLAGLNGNDPEPLIPPGLAPRRPAGRVAPVEEGSDRPGEVPQGLLLHHLGAGGQPRVPGAGGGELPALLQVARSARPAGAPVLVLLDREVPHKPRVRAVVPQHRFLGGRGEQPVPGHANALSTITDISGEVKRRFLPGLKARVPTSRS